MSVRKNPSTLPWGKPLHPGSTATQIIPCWPISARGLRGSRSKIYSCWMKLSSFITSATVSWLWITWLFPLDISKKHLKLRDAFLLFCKPSYEIKAGKYHLKIEIVIGRDTQDYKKIYEIWRRYFMMDENRFLLKHYICMLKYVLIKNKKQN